MDFAQQRTRGVLTDLRWAAVRRAKRSQSAERSSSQQIKNPEPMARGFRIHVLLLLQQIIRRHPGALTA